jgi:hypothetical protein
MTVGDGLSGLGARWVAECTTQLAIASDEKGKAQKTH